MKNGYSGEKLSLGDGENGCRESFDGFWGGFAANSSDKSGKNGCGDWHEARARRLRIEVRTRNITTRGSAMVKDCKCRNCFIALSSLGMIDVDLIDSAS